MELAIQYLHSTKYLFSSINKNLSLNPILDKIAVIGLGYIGLPLVKNTKL